MTRTVKASPPGTLFTPRDFVSYGSSGAVAKSLERLVKRGDLRRLSRGLYDKPKHDALFGILWPTPEAVIKAITDKDRIRVQPAGAYAANLLGLSEQVPAKIILLTDGTSRTLKAGPMRILLKRTTPRNMAAAGRLAGLLIQALRDLGPQHIEPRHIERLKKTVPRDERRKLLEDLDLAPVWMRRWFLELAEKETYSRKKQSPENKESDAG
jgi:hypothetical protein